MVRLPGFRIMGSAEFENLHSKPESSYQAATVHKNKSADASGAPVISISIRFTARPEMPAVGFFSGAGYIVLIFRTSFESEDFFHLFLRKKR